MRDYLIGLGYPVGVKRVGRLYKIMNLRSIYPKRNLSKANPTDYKLIAASKLSQAGRSKLSHLEAM